MNKAPDEIWIEPLNEFAWYRKDRDTAGMEFVKYLRAGPVEEQLKQMVADKRVLKDCLNAAEEHIRHLEEQLAEFDRNLASEEARERIKELEAEVERLRIGCNPACEGCGLKPNNEDNKAVLWCDECVCELKAEVARLNGEVIYDLEERIGELTVMLDDAGVPYKKLGGGMFDKL